MRLKLVAIALLLVVGGAAVFVGLGGLPRGASAATTFLTRAAAVADVSDDVAATGSIASSATWSLAFGTAPTTATAASNTSQDGTWTDRTATAKVGDIVKKGQLLATATNATLATDLTAARNESTSAALQLLEAQDAHDAATTTTAIRQTRGSLLGARNAVAAAKAKVVDLERAAARNRLVAPADGIVTAVNIVAGSDAPSGAAITLDTTDFVVTAEVASPPSRPSSRPRPRSWRGRSRRRRR